MIPIPHTDVRIPASEVEANIMPDKEATRDKARFVSNLGWLLSQTREGIVSCSLNLNDPDTVGIIYRGGTVREVNIAMDSYAAIIKDVMKHV